MHLMIRFRPSHAVKTQLRTGLFLGTLCLASPMAWSTDLSFAFNTSLLARDVAATNNFPVSLDGLSDRTADVAMHALALIGLRYHYGGNTPEGGMDCSGLVRHVFREAWGASLPRTSHEISQYAETIPQGELKPGDLVFFNTLRRAFSHVGIYLGENKFIHSPAIGGAVRVENMDLAYWKKRFNGARRIKDPGS